MGKDKQDHLEEEEAVVARRSSRFEPRWVQMLSLIGWWAGMAFFVLFLLASCTEKRDADGHIAVVDTADLLSPAAETTLTEIRFPQGTPVVLRTVDSIPLRRIGSYATDMMDKEPQWQVLRPRGFLRHYIRQDLPSGAGVFVLVSRRPHILQIRFGRDVRLAAYQAGLAAGSWYRGHQEYIGDQEIVTTVRELADRMETVAKPWWLLSWARSLSSLATAEVEDFLEPSDGLYSNWILGAYLSISERAGATTSAWRFVAFGAMLFLVVWVVGKKLLIQRFLLPRVKRGWIQFGLLSIMNVSLVGMVLTGFVALALLSKGRIEDQLALEGLGLSFISRVGFGAALFSTNGGLWCAIPGAIISFVAEAFQSLALSEEAERQGGQFGFVSWGWLGWGCALYLLPMAVAIPALVVVIWNAGSTVIGASASRD